MDLLHILVFASWFYLGSAKLEIIELKVPDPVKNGSTNEVILDCIYEVSGNESGIVLKWFYNGDVQQIYQWIPEANVHGYASGKFKNHIDLSYTVGEEITKYRAIKLVDVKPDLSGNYTCKVSSDQNEVKQTKPLIIYTPSSDGINLEINENESRVDCYASGISPEPNIELFPVEWNETYVVDKQVFVDDNELYNVSATLSFDSINLTSSTMFVCKLNIPGTNYTLYESVELIIAQVDIEIDIEEDILVNLNDTFNSTEGMYNSTEENTATSLIFSTSSVLSTCLFALILVLIQ